MNIKRPLMINDEQSTGVAVDLYSFAWEASFEHLKAVLLHCGSKCEVLCIKASKAPSPISNEFPPRWSLQDPLREFPDCSSDLLQINICPAA
jgi:hypothetical protein